MSDWRRLEQAIRCLREGRAATYQPSDWNAFDRSLSAVPIEVKPKRVVIEGVYSARPELAPLLDLGVLRQVPEAIRIQRLRGRKE